MQELRLSRETARPNTSLPGYPPRTATRQGARPRCRRSPGVGIGGQVAAFLDISTLRRWRICGVEGPMAVTVGLIGDARPKDSYP
jgi:hypothetical protein